MFCGTFTGFYKFKAMIKFNYSIEGFRVKEAKLHKLWLDKLAQSYGGQVAELVYVFMDDDELLEMNKEYLNHDYYTDIITFDLRDTQGNSPVEGNIFISVDRVKENADNLGVDFKSELLRVMAHGLLHLLGFKDKTENEQLKMREAEDKAIELFFQLKADSQNDIGG